MAWSPSEIASAEEILDLLAGKWTMAILRALAEHPDGSCRPNELHSTVGAASGTPLSGKVFYENLERLRVRGLITRMTAPPHDGCYVLTDRGRLAVQIASKANETIAVSDREDGQEAVQQPPRPSTSSQRRTGRTPWPVDITRAENPGELDTSRPSTARMYDYFLGGKDNFAADREAAERVAAAIPTVATVARENRKFLGRAVRFLAADHGIRQFIDLGAGLPTSPNVHEIARGIHPDAAVVYADNDPVVLAHARALLSTPDDAATTINADISHPEQVLGHPSVQRHIDFGEPVAVLLVAVLHFVPGDVRELITAYTQNLPPGSYLAISHGLSDGDDPALQEIEQIYSTATSPIVLRTRAEVAGLFDGFELVHPGLVDVTAWHPTSNGGEPPTGYVGALGRKP